MPRPLSLSLINRFFKILAGRLDQETYVLLTGAAAANILGQVRPSMDIDFAVRIKRGNRQAWMKMEEAIQKAVQMTGIHANYAQDIDRWGLISLMDYLKHTLPYQRFGTIKVEVLAPAYLSIGKMTRYLAPDIQDMIHVFRKQRTSHLLLSRTWGLALRKSPKSTALFHFQKQVEDFIRRYGRKIWGKQFDRNQAILRFHEAAGIKRHTL